MSKQKEHVKHYDRKNIDWAYVNFLEDKIKTLEEEIRINKKFHSKVIQERNYLKHQTIPQLENELKQSDLIKAKLFDERIELKNKINYYKQSLL